TACAMYRDFDHLIYEGTILTAERAVYVMDVASQQARDGKTSFAVTCIDDRTGTKSSCDGLSVLKAFDVKSIQQADMLNEKQDGHSATRLDIIVARPDGPPSCGDHPEEFMFNVRSAQHFGRQSM